MGSAFAANSDTEVILAAFERWGADCLPRFNGMWSFAIWDRRQRTLFLSRDRFGVKPLYVCSTRAGSLLRPSSRHFCISMDSIRLRTRPRVQARLAGNFSEHVLLRGVESVPPGHCLEVTPERTRRWRWWNTLDHLVRCPRI